MPFNGSGSFSPYTPGNPAVSGTTISSTAFNNTVTDFATGLSNAMTRDGQSPATANIPMGGKKITGLGDGSAATDAATVGQTATALAASSGSSLVGYLPAGIGAVVTTVQTKLRESVSVKDFGAVGDGVTNDQAAIVAAITAVSSAGGGRVYFPSGTYLVNASFTVPNNIMLVGSGMRSTTIKRTFTGDFITSFGGYSALEDLTIEGNTASVGTGKGVIFATSSPSSHFRNVEIQNFVQSCVAFPADSGATFRANGCNFYTTGAIGTVGAVACTGTDTAATSRQFYNCESGGCTLYDFSGMNDVYVSGGYTRGFITNASTSKLLMNNCRVANIGALTIAGGNHRIDTCVFADVVTLTCNNSHFNSEVPGYAITDSGTGNDVFQKSVLFTPTWTASGAAPAYGSASVKGIYSRQGNVITGEVDITFAADTTVGTGAWSFSLPRIDYASGPVQMCGSGFAQNAAASASCVFAVRVTPGAQAVQGFYADTAGIPQNLGAVKPAATWGSGSAIRFSFSYYTP